MMKNKEIRELYIEAMKNSTNIKPGMARFFAFPDQMLRLHNQVQRISQLASYNCEK